MVELNDKELKNTVGGISIWGIIGIIAGAIFGIGVIVGTAIRRLGKKGTCSLN